MDTNEYDTIFNKIIDLIEQSNLTNQDVLLMLEIIKRNIIDEELAQYEHA